ncbi:MAG: NBR1-Ig-like domain-containing protein, partial [Chloroflexota bacterium]
MKLRTRFVAILASAIWLALLAACAAASKPNVVIMSPPSGSQYFEGEDIAVQSSATDTVGVVRVELVVDGAVVRVDPSPTAQGQPNFTLIQTWKATTGVHTILVRAYNAAGAVSDPAGVSVNILQRTAQAPTLAPTVPSAPPPPGVTVVPSPIPPTVVPSPVPPAPGPSSCTNTAAFVQDVTVPDGTNWAPGQAFNKIWQVRNTGTCTWSGYQLVFASGEAMTTNSTAAIPATAPGATADILVPMTAPSSTGAHAGQWRLQSPSGLFGPTLTVSINVVSGGGGSPPSSGCSGTPNIASFTSSAPSVISGNPVTLSWGAVTNAESAEIDHGIGGIETPGSRVVNPTVYTTYTLTARCGANVATKQVTIAVLAAPIAVPPAPSLSSPAEGWVFRNYPRTATFTWNAVSAPGTVTYNIEIQINTGSWQNKATQTGLAGTSYAMSAFSGDNPGRWRVWATSSTSGEGAKSDWRGFSFNTSASQYAGTWLNNDSGTSGVTKIIISNSGQTLNVHPYGKCTPTDCNWGT